MASYEAAGVMIGLLHGIQGSFRMIFNLDVNIHMFSTNPVEDSLTFN